MTGITNLLSQQPTGHAYLGGHPNKTRVVVEELSSYSKSFCSLVGEQKRSDIPQAY